MATGKRRGWWAGPLNDLKGSQRTILINGNHWKALLKCFQLEFSALPDWRKTFMLAASFQRLGCLHQATAYYTGSLQASRKWLRQCLMTGQRQNQRHSLFWLERGFRLVSLMVGKQNQSIPAQKLQILYDPGSLPGPIRMLNFRSLLGHQ